MTADQHGDLSRAEFETRVVAAFPAVFRFAVTLSSIDDAEDLAQDTLVRAWTKRRQFDEARGTFQSWLMGILVDQARGRWRRRRTLDLGVSVEDVAGPEARTASSVDLARAVAALPARQRDALVLQLYVDLPLQEIATLMNCSLGTVKATLHAARTHVTATLGEGYVRD